MGALISINVLFSEKCYLSVPVFKYRMGVILGENDLT